MHGQPGAGHKSEVIAIVGTYFAAGRGQVLAVHNHISTSNEIRRILSHKVGYNCIPSPRSWTFFGPQSTETNFDRFRRTRGRSPSQTPYESMDSPFSRVTSDIRRQTLV